MPRPHKCRFVAGMPEATAFKPAGIPGRGLAVVELGLDEAEAIRLADLQGFYQEEAARRMGVSRATFGRVLDSAHQKIADAIINGKMLVFKGGNVSKSQVRGFVCGDCGYQFSAPLDGKLHEQCPTCQSKNIQWILESQNGPPFGPGGMRPGCRRRFRGGRGPGR